MDTDPPRGRVAWTMRHAYRTTLSLATSPHASLSAHLDVSSLRDPSRLFSDIPSLVRPSHLSPTRLPPPAQLDISKPPDTTRSRLPSTRPSSSGPHDLSPLRLQLAQVVELLIQVPFVLGGCRYPHGAALSTDQVEGTMNHGVHAVR